MAGQDVPVEVLRRRTWAWREDEVVGHPATILRPDDPALDLARVCRGDGRRDAHRRPGPLSAPGRPAARPELFVAPLRDEGGGVRGAVVVAEDVTAIHEAQSDRARLATAIDQAAEAIVVTDPDGRIIYANPAFERVTGYARAELRDRTRAFSRAAPTTRPMHERHVGHPDWPAEPGGALLANRRKDGRTSRRRPRSRPCATRGRTTAYRRREARPDRRARPRGRPSG